MDCFFIQNHLFDYQENKLLVNEKIAFDDHLRSCRECKVLYQRFDSVLGRIEELKAVEVDPFLSTRLMQRIENELLKENTVNFSSVFVRIKPVVAILGIFLAITIGILIGKSGSSHNKLPGAHSNEILSIQTDLHITDFIDEDNILISSH